MNSKDNLFTSKIEEMHDKFGVTDWVMDQMGDGNYDTIRKFIEFRIDTQLHEELEETSMAAHNGEPEEIVDGLVDILVFALGTLDLLGVDSKLAWRRVMDANLAKEVGIKPGRPNPFGLPDLVKPEGWVGPIHGDNHGILDRVYAEERKIYDH